MACYEGMHAMRLNSRTGIEGLPVSSLNCDNWRLCVLLVTELISLTSTATGLDNIPSWCLCIGAPVFASPLADILNLSLTSSVVPTQWKSASVLPFPKVAAPLSLSHFRPISILPSSVGSWNVWSSRTTSTHP